jgi:hypothetical protein
VKKNKLYSKSAQKQTRLASIFLASYFFLCIDLGFLFFNHINLKEKNNKKQEMIKNIGPKSDALNFNKIAKTL